MVSLCGCFKFFTKNPNWIFLNSYSIEYETQTLVQLMHLYRTGLRWVVPWPNDAFARSLSWISFILYKWNFLPCEIFERQSEKRILPLNFEFVIETTKNKMKICSIDLIQHIRKICGFVCIYSTQNYFNTWDNGKYLICGSCTDILLKMIILFEGLKISSTAISYLTIFFSWKLREVLEFA